MAQVLQSLTYACFKRKKKDKSAKTSSPKLGLEVSDIPLPDVSDQPNGTSPLPKIMGRYAKYRYWAQNDYTHTHTHFFNWE